ncbi:LysR substrate-binding domain-containing protein [Dongia deserti]|uniref:LysR substrate-binding domain-containing protein n=1 Tax=Dongia deserti TaxID=2268030 RepID=UPI0013C452DE|nr:LysR substrate-binding domain-containing protein [Dongia deserti]
MLEPDLLRTFLAICDAGGFTAAGAVVGRTQSAVSMQMRRLEEQLGCSLFHRSAHEVALTPQGEVLRRHARLILNAQQAALAALDRPDVPYEISLAIPDDYALGLLPPVLRDIATVHPNASVNITCEPSREIIRNMAEGAYDLALVTEGQGPVTGPVVHQEPCHWVSSANGDVHGVDPLPVAFRPEDDTYRRWAIDRLVEHGRSFRIAYTSTSMAAIRGAVASGLAVSVMARSSMTTAMRALTRADGFPDLPVLRICLITSPRNRTEMVQALENFLVKRMRERAGGIVDRPTPAPQRIRKRVGKGERDPAKRRRRG